MKDAGEQASQYWLKVWDAARRAISVSTISRAACHLLTVLVDVELLKTTVNSSFINKTLFGGGNNGPCSLTDTSLILFTTILRSGIFENDKQFELFSLKVVGW